MAMLHKQGRLLIPLLNFLTHLPVYIGLHILHLPHHPLPLPLSPVLPFFLTLLLLYQHLLSQFLFHHFPFAGLEPRQSSPFFFLKLLTMSATCFSRSTAMSSMSLLVMVHSLRIRAAFLRSASCCGVFWNSFAAFLRKASHFSAFLNIGIVVGIMLGARFRANQVGGEIESWG